ncbi:MAG: hypothetical protein PUD90_03310 [Clostridia bacterium]|nr:hypothetical protein [Clostridia bacterium]
MTKLKINVNDKNEIVSDSDNLAHSFEFYADDSDDKNLKIVMKYYLPRGGVHEIAFN